jgi:hypothetical protein
MFEKVKKDLLTDDEWVNIAEDDKTLSEIFKGYPKNLVSLNKEISNSLWEERFNKWAYYNPKKILQDILKTPEKYKRNDKIEKALQPQIELAAKISPDKWAENVSLESPELDKGSNEIFVKLLNWFFKSLLWIDIFKNIGKDYDSVLEESGNLINKVWSMIGGSDSQDIGSMLEIFESGWKWPYAININDGWTPSFGTYQLHNDFLWQFAKENWIKWDFHKTWKDTEFARNWISNVKKIWLKQFKEKENDFIQKTHYEPQINKIISATWTNPSNFSMSLKSVIWSTCVQHWPNTDIVVTAINNLWKKIDFSDLKNQKKLIIEIYKIRWLRKKSKIWRYNREQKIALKNLDIISTDLKDIPKWIKSFPAERSSQWTTLCSKTAHKNLTQTFWVTSKLDDAMNVYNFYKWKWVINSNFPPSNWKVADLFSSSIKYPKYGHRSVAFMDNWNWYVLDPYLPVYWKWKRTTNPIRWEDYNNYLKKAWRQFYWARVV